MFSRFHTMPACHGRKDRRTDRITRSISRVSSSMLTRDKNEIIAEPEELYFTHMGRKNPWSDLQNILHWDVITDANLWDDRLSHFSVARGQISGFSIGFRSRPYNTLALPCECVITAAYWIFMSELVKLPRHFTKVCNTVYSAAEELSDRFLTKNFG